MKAFRVQVALAVLFIMSAVTGAINLIWLAVTHMIEIKVARRSLYARG